MLAIVTDVLNFKMDKTQTSVYVLIAMGYRRVSNSYCRVSRIDREDWVEFLAKELRCAPADFIVRDGSGMISSDWYDFYRRIYSNDNIILSKDDFKKVPGSNNDPVGYITLEEAKAKHPEYFI